MNRVRIQELNEKRISQLHPIVAEKAKEFLSLCEERLAYVLLVVSGLRTFKEQNILYTQGRTAPGRIVTNAKAGQSLHNYGIAFDYLILKENPPSVFTVDWNDEKFLGPAYDKCREIARQMGLELIELHPGVPDRPHIQYTGGWTWRELLAAGYGKELPVSAIPIPKPEKAERKVK